MAFDPPVFDNFDPGPGSFGNPIDVDVFFDVTDAYGINLSTLDVLFNSSYAVNDGVALDGYSVTYTPTGDGYGYSVKVAHDTDFNPLDTVSVELYCENNLGVLGQDDYSFKIISDTAPEFSEFSPPAYSVDQPEDADIIFEVTDPAENGIDPTSINVFINHIPAVLNSEPLDGYSFELFPVLDGYFVTVEAPRFEPYSRVFVGLEATTLDGNSGGVEYFYDVGEKAFPDIINQSPAPLDTDVPRDTDVCFDLVDYTEVDLDSVQVRINGAVAFDDGEFLHGFDDPNSEVVPITDGYDGYSLEDGYYFFVTDILGYSFCIDKAVDFNYGEVVNVEVDVADTLGNSGTHSYYFTAISEATSPVFIAISPAPDEEGVAHDSHITFEFTDTESGADLSSLNATLAGADAIVAGIFQDGYSGSTEFNGDGYVVTIIPNLPLPNYEIISVGLSGQDFVGNGASYDYHFLTEDVNIPLFESLFPAPGATDVPPDTHISFSFNDKRGVGADIDSLRVFMQGSLVLEGTTPSDGYEVTIVTNDKDGYDVTLFPDNPLEEFANIPVFLDGYDSGGLYGYVSYSWQTADQSGPIFDRIIPIYPGDKVGGDTAISVDIIDTGVGVDVTTLSVTVDGYDIIDQGVVKPLGYVATLSPISDGYRLGIQSIGPLPHLIDSDTTALWRMDSLTTAIPNATGNASLDGTAIGTLSVSGKFDRARQFGSSGDRIEIGTSPELMLQNFTVEAWIKPTGVSGDHVIYTYNPRQTSSQNRGTVFKITADRRLAIDIGNGAAPYYTISTGINAIPLDTYTHVAAVVSRDRNYIKLLVNGAEEASEAFPVSIQYNDGPSGSPSTGTALIGTRISPLTAAYIDRFEGDIDDLRFSGAIRSVSEVANSYNRAQRVLFAEYESIPVDIFVQDNVGNDGYISYAFQTLDETPPDFDSFDPYEGQDRIDPNTNIAFDFTDIHSGPDLDSLYVYIDGRLVVEDGVGLVDTSISASPIVDGYRVEIDLDYPLPQYKNILVVLDGYDIDPNQTLVSYYFSTDDITPPVLVNPLPEPDSIEVNPFTDVIFDIHDFNASGLNESTLNVLIDDRNVIINGVAQPGWNISTSSISVDGYEATHYVIGATSRYALNSIIDVIVDGYDAYGNYFDDSFSFTTYQDVDAPQITDLSPQSNEIEVALNTDVEFSIVDGYDIDLSRLDVHIDNLPAILDGVFQSGFDGFSGGITEIADGYAVTIDPETDFVYNQQVTVVIDGYDFSNNHVNFEYYFYTIADADAPVISNRDPAPGDVEVGITSDVKFDITDAVSGVDMTRTTAHIDNIPALINSVIQPGWNGPSSGIETISDGYRVVLDPTGAYSFTYNQIHSVTIDGYDHALNHVHENYWFATVSDPNGPIIDSLDPAVDAVEVPVSSNISFNITDGVSGVDMTRLMVHVDAVRAVDSGVIKYPFNDSASGITTIVDGYTVVLDYVVDFEYDDIITVTIDGYDYANNHAHLAYSFHTKIDVDGPTVTPIDPIQGAGDYPRDTNIVFRIKDYETGVDFSATDVRVEGSLVIEEGEFVVGSGFDGPQSQIIKILDGYEVVIEPTSLFEPNVNIPIEVDAYDHVGNHTNFDYYFTTIDDEGPYIREFYPLPNSINAENDPVHVSFGIDDYGNNGVKLHSIIIEVAENYDEPYKQIWDVGSGFFNGWTGTLDGHPDYDGYLVNAYRTEQSASFAVYSFRIRATDGADNSSVSIPGKPIEDVASASALVTDNKVNVGAGFIAEHGIEAGDMLVMNAVGAFEIDGYSGENILLSESAGVGGLQEISIYRGTFMVARRYFGPQQAEAASIFSVDLTFSDPYKLVGPVLSPAGYTISGGDFPVTVTDVQAVDDDTVELTTTYMQPEVLYTVTAANSIYNFVDFPVDDGYESTTFTGYPDVVKPRILEALVAPFNINITVVFDDYMTQDAALLNPGNYTLDYGAYVSAVNAGPLEADRVILTVENLYNRSPFTLVVSTDLKDRYGNNLDPDYSSAQVVLEETGAALAGITGRLKTRNDVQRVHEDSNNWYIGTTGGLDIVSKRELENQGFVLDGYGVNALTSDEDYVYMGSNDGYNEDAYGVTKLAFVDAGGNSTDLISDAFSVPRILSNDVNDLTRVKYGEGPNIIAVATTAGATVFVDGYGVHYSAGNNISAVALDPVGTILYVGNNTLGQVEVYYGINTNTVSNPVPGAVYSTTTSPELSNATINQIAIAESESIMDSGSNSIYVATDFGLTRIDTDESEPGASEPGGISFTYGTAGSGMNYEILGGTVNRVKAVDVNIQRLQAFVMTDDNTHDGGITTINTYSNTYSSFLSKKNGELVSNQLRDLTFQNL